MITLKSRIKGIEQESGLEFFKFPGGEWDMKTDAAENEKPLYAYVQFEPEHKELTEDLIKLSLWVDYCHCNGHKAKILMPYLPAARADRGVPFGAKIYANLINSLDADEIVIFDPHSPVMPKMIKNVRIIEPVEAVKEEVLTKQGKNSAYTAVIAPDAGAAHRAGIVAQAAGLPVIQAEKERDFKTGWITNYNIEIPDKLKNGKMLVMDDICDGGMTFKILAESTKIPKEQLSLWVSHGIFSGKADELTNYYGEIITTDSVKPYHNIATHIKLQPYLF